jgi:hypothetical protein
MKLSLYIFILSCLFNSAVCADEDKKQPELKDIFFGEVLNSAFQDDFFNAIAKLDTELGQYYSLDEPGLDPFHHHIDQAEFSVGDLELSYRMHRRAGRAIKAVLEGNVNQSVRNEAAYRLARIYFQKNLAVNALDVLEKIKGDMPESVRADEAFLRSQVYIATGDFSKAVKILKSLQGEKSLQGFAAYNLGIALIQNDQEKEGIVQLNKVGKINSDNREVLALKDKANLALGYRMLESGAPEQAQKYMERVRLDGPFSNRALLGLGWTYGTLGRFDQALVPWSILHKRNVTNSSVQEAMLAVPYAYGKLDVHGKAAILYGHAMDVFGDEVISLDKSIKSIREGKFLVAMIREESKKDSNWLVNLRDLEDSPETHYIMQIMASHDFQESLKNYKDLADLLKHVSSWLESLDVYEEIIEIRHRYYKPLLPVIEKQFKKLDSRIKLRIEQRDRMDKRLKALLVSRRPDHLATADERTALDMLTKIDVYLDSNPKYKTEEVNERVKRLKGVVFWDINADYNKRLTEVYKHFHQLDELIDKLDFTYRSFVRTRQAATQSYEGYSIPIRQFRTKLLALKMKVTGIMARQGRMLENMAINELDQRREHLEEYQIKARFALAESYDRATKKQQEDGVTP